MILCCMTFISEKSYDCCTTNGFSKIYQGRYEICSSLDIKSAMKKTAGTQGKFSAEESAVGETVSRDKLRPLKRKKDDVYRAVSTINAIESLKVLPVRYKRFLVANEHRYM